jgi:ethanolamine ammonia-lyase small subunit
MTDAPALWRDLRRFTAARVALGRVGNGMPTAAHLAFQAAHAAARDAVHGELDAPVFAARLSRMYPCAPRIVRSACPDRKTYLVRPDLGRDLHPADRAELIAEASAAPNGAPTVAFVVCDGLSATAVEHHAAALLARSMRALGGGPVVIVRQGRVAVGDAVGEALGAACVVVLIGERPGLSSPDSLGAYITWAPRIGRTDAERNCISNIRAGGLPVEAAADKLIWLVGEMRRRRLSGVALKDEQPAIGATAAVPGLPG